MKIKLGSISVYLTINSDEHGPIEVFCRVGKAGSDERAYCQALCKLISQSLQRGESKDDRDKILRGLALSLRGIEGQSNGWFREINFKSVPDVIGWGLQGFPDKSGEPMKFNEEHKELGK